MNDDWGICCKTNKMLFRSGGSIRRSPSEDQVRYLFKGQGNDKLYKFSNEHARTSLVFHFLLFIENFGDLSPHAIHQLWGTYFEDEMTCDNLWMIDVTLILSAAMTIPLYILWIRLNCNRKGISRSVFGWDN